MARAVWLYWSRLQPITSTHLSEVRLAFSKHGGNIAEKGAVAFQFDHKGMIRVHGTGDDLMLQALDAGAEDVQEEGEESSSTLLQPTWQKSDGLREAGLAVTEAKLTYVPNTTIEVTDADTAGKICASWTPWTTSTTSRTPTSTSTSTNRCVV